jgi:hypothetical protein
MPETETIVINGNPLIIEKVATSGELIIASLLTVIISLVLGAIVLYILGGRR